MKMEILVRKEGSSVIPVSDNKLEGAVVSQLDYSNSMKEDGLYVVEVTVKSWYDNTPEHVSMYVGIDRSSSIEAVEAETYEFVASLATGLSLYGNPLSEDKNFYQELSLEDKIRKLRGGGNDKI